MREENKYLNTLITRYNNTLGRTGYFNQYQTSLEKITFNLYNKPIKNVTGYVVPKSIRYDIILSPYSFIQSLHYSRNEQAFRRFYINNKMPKLWQKELT